MIAASLTDIREGPDGEIKLEKIYGHCELPPLLGERLIITKPDGTVVKTGVIELIEWLGNITGNGNFHFNGKRRVVGKDCLFYTNGSAYRWKKIDENTEDGK